MIRDRLGLDDRDTLILSTLMKRPETSQIELAKILKISQPSVNSRIKKLNRRGLVSTMTGIDFGKTDLYLVRVDFTATHAQHILETLLACSFFVNGFVLSGKHNASIMIVGYDLKKVETIINTHLRTNPEISEITTSVIVSAAKPFIYSIPIEQEHHDECQNVGSCERCPVIPKNSLKTSFLKNFEKAS